MDAEGKVRECGQCRDMTAGPRGCCEGCCAGDPPADRDKRYGIVYTRRVAISNAVVSGAAVPATREWTVEVPSALVAVVECLGRLPSKVVAVHLNYASRARERGRVPEYPSYFLKSPSSLSGSGMVVIRPRGCELLAFEGEIAVVLGKPARNVPRERAWSYVAGVTAANDFGVYDLRYADRGANVRSKGADGFTPVGPRLLDARRVDPADLRLRTWVNGELVQDAVTAELCFGFDQLVADLPRLMTLEPGDVILTGTPAGSSVTVPGDVVENEVSAPHETTGRLRSVVAAAADDLDPVGAMPRTDDAARVAAFGPGHQPRPAVPAAGIVTDGALRDSAAIAAMELPVYSAGAHPAVLGRRHVPWESGVTVACGGVLVQPGDVLVGDDDGVVVIPPQLAPEVAADAVEQERQERFIAERVRAGESVVGLYSIGPGWRPAYEDWCARRCDGRTDG